jgi:hypothetical protein
VEAMTGAICCRKRQLIENCQMCFGAPNLLNFLSRLIRAAS